MWNCEIDSLVSLITRHEHAQGIIYPVSHRSLRIEFGALRNNCETQSKKVRIKKIKRETVQPPIANRDRQQSLSAATATADPAKAARISAHVVCVLITVDQNLIRNGQRAYSVTTTSFANIRKKSSSQSFLLRIVITSGFPDVSTHVCTFISRTAGRNVSRFPSPMCPASGFSLTSRPGQERCLQSCSKNGDRLRATRTSFLQGVRELQ